MFAPVTSPPVERDLAVFDSVRPAREEGAYQKVQVCPSKLGLDVQLSDLRLEIPAAEKISQ